MLVRMANREDPDQTASEGAIWSGSALFVKAFWQATTVQNFITFTENVLKFRTFFSFYSQ